MEIKKKQKWAKTVEEKGDEKKIWNVRNLYNYSIDIFCVYV